MATDTEREAAERRVVEKLELYLHAATYAVVICALALVNLFTGPGYLWFLWPMAGWGVALVLHALRVFMVGNRGLRERMIDREIRSGRSG